MTTLTIEVQHEYGENVWHRVSGCRGKVIGFCISGDPSAMIITYKVVWDDRSTDWHYGVELTDKWVDATVGDTAEDKAPTDS